jgi:hypothetical protein
MCFERSQEHCLGRWCGNARLRDFDFLKSFCRVVRTRSRGLLLHVAQILELPETQLRLSFFVDPSIQKTCWLALMFAPDLQKQVERLDRSGYLFVVGDTHT